VLAVVPIFGLNVVLGNFARPDWRAVGIRRVFDAVDDASLVGLAFFGEISDAFHVDVFDVGQALQIARLSGFPQTDTLMDLG
jgi:hypothetical protein